MRRNMLRNTAIASCLLIVVSGSTSPGSACGFHGSLGDGFSSQHPKSIDVAIALRDAADTNLLDKETVAPRAADLFAFHRAVNRLNHLRDALQGTAIDVAVPSFSILLVESGMWSRYTIADGGIRFFAHTDAPTASAPVVVTGNAVLAAIGAGRLTSQDAIRRGLIVVDGPPALVQALTIALDQRSADRCALELVTAAPAGLCARAPGNEQ